MSICYLNGEFVALAEARIPVLDRGFIFGDGIYEVIPVLGRRPFRLQEHLARLARSLTAVGICEPMTASAWQALVYEVIARNPLGDLSLYLQVTRGIAPRNHAPPSDCAPTVFAMTSPLAANSEPSPVRIATMLDIRWQRCDIKATSLLPNVMARSAAAAADSYEAVLFRDGLLTEGAASNVFVAHDGLIKTPPRSNWILPGITRDALIEALAHGPDAIHEVPITRAEFAVADEIWLTSSTRDLVPVSHLDGHPVGFAHRVGVPGSVYRRVNAVYAQFKTAELAVTPTAPLAPD